MWLFLLACQMFYYSDEEVSQVEMTPVVSGWNVGVQRASSSTVKILVMSHEESLGHGSGNLFYYLNELFIVTCSHVVNDNLNYLIQECPSLGIDNTHGFQIPLICRLERGTIW